MDGDVARASNGRSAAAHCVARRWSATSGSTNHRTSRGTALMLVPAMMLILIALGSIAVDMTALFAAQRASQQIIAAAADDAAGMLDSRLIQQDGTLAIDPVAASRVATAHVDTADLPGALVGPVVVQVASDGQTVRVQVTVRVAHVMMRAVPGAGDDELIVVSSTGRLTQ